MQQHHLDHGLQGKGRPQLGAMVREAWQLSLRPNLLFFCLVMIMSLLFYVAFEWGTKALDARGLEREQAVALVMMIAVMMVSPLTAMLELMGVKIAMGDQITRQDLQVCIRAWPRLVLLTLTILIVVDLGLALWVAPGIYLIVSLSLANLVLVIFGASPLQAAIWAIRVAHHHWWVVGGVMALAALALTIGSMGFGLGLIWLAPFAFILRGILFRELFGLQSSASQPVSTTVSDDSNFVA